MVLSDADYARYKMARRSSGDFASEEHILSAMAATMTKVLFISIPGVIVSAFIR